MKKTFHILAAAALLLSAAPLAAADPMAKLTKELIMKELDAKLGSYQEQWDYWKGIKNDIVTGDIDALVNKAVDEAVRQTKEKINDAKSKTTNWEIAWTIFEKLAPEALAPIAVLKGTSEFVHDRTQAWLDWAIQNREEDFYNMVLAPEKSPDVAKLDYNWGDYEEWVVPAGLADRGVLYAQRKAILARNKANYQKRRAELVARENRRSSAQSIEEVKTRLAKRLNWIRRETEREVKDAQDMLKLAKLPQTEENILRYINDVPFHNELVRKWWKMVEEHQAEADASTPLGRAAQIMAQAADKPTQTPDYSVVLREYGLNSDRFVANAVAPAEFTTLRDSLHNAATELNQSCVDACRGMVEQSPERKNCFNGCETGWKAYDARRQEVDKNREDLLSSLRARLEAPARGAGKKPLDELYARLAGDYNSLSWAAEKDRADGLIEDCRRGNSDTCLGAWQVAWEYYWSGVKGTPPKRLIKLEEMRKNSERLAHAAAVYASLGDPAAVKGKEFQDRTAAYQQELSAEMNKYAELCQQNGFLAQLMTVPCYDFYAQTRSLQEAMGRISSPRDFVSPQYLAALHSGKNAALKERAAWADEIAANERELQAARQTAAELEALASWGYKGKSEKLDQKFLEGYFDKELKDLLVNFMPGALALLDENTKGALYDNSNKKEYASVGGALRPVSEISASPSYASLAEHRAKLELFAGKLAELKDLDLERRLGKADAAYSALVGAAGKLRVPAEELIALVQTAQQLRGGMGRLANKGIEAVYNGEQRTLDYPTLEAVYKEYEKKIAAAEDYEKKAMEACQRAKADPKFDYRDFTSALIGANKWKPSQETLQLCGEANGAKYSAEAKAFRKFTPFAEVTVAGRPLAAGELSLKSSDLPGGKVRVSGKLIEDTADYRQVYVTLNSDFGSLYNSQLANLAGRSFEYEFAPKPGETYYIAVKALGADGLASLPLPAGNTFLTLKYEQGDKTDEIRAFYDRFRAAYEGRSAAQVLALVSGDWTAGDGTELTDLEESLRNNFRLYDEIKYEISGLNISKGGRGWQACYDVAITSRIFKRNLKHEEKSKVCDEVGEEGGRLKLLRTASGSYWYVK